MEHASSVNGMFRPFLGRWSTVTTGMVTGNEEVICIDNNEEVICIVF